MTMIRTNESQTAQSTPPTARSEQPRLNDQALSGRFRSTTTQTRGIPFLGCFESTVANLVWRREVREGDGFHPDAAGYEQLAAIIQAPLLEWLTPHAIGASQN